MKTMILAIEAKKVQDEKFRKIYFQKLARTIERNLGRGKLTRWVMSQLEKEHQDVLKRAFSLVLQTRDNKENYYKVLDTLKKCRYDLPASLTPDQIVSELDFQLNH